MSIKLQRSIPATPVNIFIFPELAHTQRSLLISAIVGFKVYSYYISLILGSSNLDPLF